MYRCPRCEEEGVRWIDAPSSEAGFWRIERTARCVHCGHEESGLPFTRSFHDLVRRWRRSEPPCEPGGVR